MKLETLPRKKATRIAILIGAGLAAVVILFSWLAEEVKLRGRRLVKIREHPFSVEIENKVLGFTVSKEQWDFSAIEQSYPGRNWQAANQIYESSFRIVNFSKVFGESAFDSFMPDLKKFDAFLKHSANPPAAERVDAVLLSFMEGHYGETADGTLEDLWNPGKSPPQTP